MKIRLTITLVAAVGAISLVAANPALGATEFGDPCTADSGTGSSKVTVFGLSSPVSPLPLAAPSAGVITAWKLSLITPEPPSKPIPAVLPQTLKVVRLNTVAKTAQVVGESSGFVGSGVNTIPARIPVQTGDHLALFGSGEVTVEGSTSEVGTLFCEEAAGPSDVYGGFLGTISPGASSPYEEGSGARVPAVAILEPDADNDGFGDETQDKCPQSAATQAACPVVTLNVSATATKKLVTLLVTGPVAANVTVNGVVSLGKGKKAKLKGGTKAITPGAFTKFKLKFTSALAKRLKELPPSKKLTLKVTSSAPNLVGAPTKKVIKVKLKGQG